MPAATLTLTGVTVGTRLRGITGSFDPAVPTVIVGPNGAGKSTLVRAIAGLERGVGGTVRVGDLTRAGDPRRWAGCTAWLPQHPRLEEGLTALDVVAAGRFRFAEPRRVAEHAAHRALEAFDAARWAERPMTTLSGGEAQRVRLAAMHAQDAAWWLLDEPFNHLDPGVRLGLLERVAERARAGGGVLLVTHDLTLVPWLGGARVLALAEGTVAWDGLVTDPGLPSAVGPLLGIEVAAVQRPEGLRFVVVGAA